jgi:protein ImuA
MHAAPGSPPAAGSSHPSPGTALPGTLPPAALHPDVWRADQLSHPVRPGCPSGFAALDAELPGGGWPPGALTELLIDGPGQGELRLLAPALARLGQAGLAVVWVGTPGLLRPYAPALQAWGLALPRLLWVDTASSPDAAWAAEQAVTTQGIGAVLCWAPRLHTTALRRLHLAAQDRACLLFMLRPSAVAQHASPAPLRLACRPSVDTPGALQVQLLKRRGPLCATPVRLDSLRLFAPPLAARLRKARSSVLVPPLSTALSTGLPDRHPPPIHRPSTAYPTDHTRPGPQACPPTLAPSSTPL